MRLKKDQIRSDQNRTEQNRTEQNRTAYLTNDTAHETLNSAYESNVALTK